MFTSSCPPPPRGSARPLRRSPARPLARLKRRRLQREGGRRLDSSIRLRSVEKCEQLLDSEVLRSPVFFFVCFNLQAASGAARSVNIALETQCGLMKRAGKVGAAAPTLALQFGIFRGFLFFAVTPQKYYQSMELASFGGSVVRTPPKPPRPNLKCARPAAPLSRSCEGPGCCPAPCLTRAYVKNVRGGRHLLRSNRSQLGRRSRCAVHVSAVRYSAKSECLAPPPPL